MAFIAFIGRLLFASLFILYAYQLTSKVLQKCKTTTYHAQAIELLHHHLNDRHKEENMYNEFGTDGGPIVKTLEPKLHVFSKLITSKVGIQVPHIDTKNLVVAVIFLKGLGGIGFIFGSYAGAILLVLNQLIFTPVMCDFYNYDPEDKEFGRLLTKFTQNMALLGALLYFIGMKHSISLRKSRRNSKTKTS